LQPYRQEEPPLLFFEFQELFTLRREASNEKELACDAYMAGMRSDTGAINLIAGQLHNSEAIKLTA
jgi:hypothetical protein